MDWNEINLGALADQVTTVDSGSKKDFAPLPAGEYEMVIEELGEPKRTSKGGYACKVTYQIIDGEHKGRKIWDNCLNILKADGKTPQFGVNTLNNIAKVRGMKPGYNPQDLVGYAFPAMVKIEPAQPKNDGSGESWPEKPRIHYVLVSDEQEAAWKAAKEGKEAAPQTSINDVITQQEADSIPF